MARELLLLRHGKSDWRVDIDDFDRPLKDRGKRGAQRIGAWLQQHELVPDYIVSSPAERARSTTEKCAKVMGVGVDAINYDQRIYEADLSQLLAVLSNIPPTTRRVLMVGHNPGFEMLLTHLSEQPVPHSADGKVMPTATLARLGLPDDWQSLPAGSAELLGITRASKLPEKFPFPTPDDEELRDRPAYYYTQSGVIPFRLRDGELEILIIRSSGNKHWTLPKGIADPGHTLQESAMKEALEEAGVSGEIVGDRLGQYTADKWGGTCTVSVYAMRVTEQLGERDWEESHRGRIWLPATEAAARLRQRALAPMVMKLARRLRTDASP